VAFTLDRYAKLLPGSVAEAVTAIDAFIARVDTSARLAAPELAAYLVGR
jgi:hypothetical protein